MFRKIQEMQIKAGFDNLALEVLRAKYSESEIALLHARIGILRNQIDQLTKDIKDTKNIVSSCFSF